MKKKCFGGETKHLLSIGTGGCQHISDLKGNRQILELRKLLCFKNILFAWRRHKAEKY